MTKKQKSIYSKQYRLKNKEKLKESKSAYFKSLTPLQRVFRGLMCRTSHEKCKDYPNYGGRGIGLSWKNSKEFERDMLESYVEHKKNNTTTQIERIDNNKGYSKENCKWATTFEQNRNKRTNKYLTYKGETLIFADWARRLGCSRQTLRNRVMCGWSIRLIMETPIDYANRYDTKKKKVNNKKNDKS